MTLRVVRSPNDADVPKRKPGEGILEWLQRIAEVNGWVKDGASPVKPMPEARLPYKEPRVPGEDDE